jgi:DNA polymerase (family X)
MDENRRIAQILRQIAALLDEQGVAFKPAAYRKAAQTIEQSTERLTEKTDKELKALPGIGDAIAQKILEFGKTGKIKFYEELIRKQGDLPEALLNVEGLGPKRVRELFKMGVKSVDDLIKFAEDGKLRSLPRMSELLEKKILENAKNVTERSRRFPREEVVDDVETLLKAIRKIKGVVRAEAAGSYRRHKDTVGDIDILAVADDPPAIGNAVAKLPLVQTVVAHGQTKVSFNLASLLRVDVRFVHPDEWGGALLYFTGDKEHNITMRKIAIAKGWKLNEYGLSAGEKVLASKTEEEIYSKLGLKWIDPKERTGNIS